MVLFALFLEENMEIVIFILVGLFAYATFKVANERDKDE